MTPRVATPHVHAIGARTFSLLHMSTAHGTWCTHCPLASCRRTASTQTFTGPTIETYLNWTGRSALRACTCSLPTSTDTAVHADPTCCRLPSSTSPSTDGTRSTGRGALLLTRRAPCPSALTRQGRNTSPMSALTVTLTVTRDLNGETGTDECSSAAVQPLSHPSMVQLGFFLRYPLLCNSSTYCK